MMWLGYLSERRPPRGRRSVTNGAERLCRALAMMALFLLAPSAVASQSTAALDLDAIAKLVADGELTSAERELRRIVEVEDSPAARDLLGLVAARRGRLEEAEREFRRAIELESEFAPARQNLGRLALQQGRPDEALEHLRVAQRAAPLERELAFQLAGLEIERGDVSVGEELYRRIAEEHGSVRALLGLARSLTRRGEGQMAIAVARRALVTAPNSQDVLSAYARLCIEHNAPVPAMKALVALTRLYPTVAEYFYLLGLAQLQMSEWDAAVEAFRRSLDLEPGEVLPLFALGLTLRDQKRFAEAKEVLTESLRLMPSNARALVVLAEVEEGLGDLDVAERHLQRALELAGENPEAMYVLGKIRYAQRRYEEAREALERSIENGPSRPRNAHYVLSLVYARLGDREKSREFLELYRQETKEAEELLIKMRTDAGLGVSGMRGGG